MISDYPGYGMFSGRQESRRPVCDMWGTVLAASDSTEAGNVRVKVKIMRDKMDTFDNVPVLTSYGGNNYGAFVLPEEGDIVRLTFPGGDFRHPVVTGCRFPESSQFVKDMCQKEAVKKAFRAKNGSGIVFSGDKGKEKIEVSGSEHMEWRLDEEKQQLSFGDKEQKNFMTLDKKNKSVRVTSQSSLRLECGKSSLELKKDGTIVLNCEKLTVEAKTVEIQGKSRVKIHGQELALEGKTGVSVTGKGQVKVNSKGPLKLSGAMIHLN